MDRILVVDDERGIRNVLKDILEVEGYSVDSADSAINALKMIDKRRYNLIISDITMEGMSGIELYDKIRETNPEIPFVVISGFARVPIAVELIKKGAFDVIEKPLEISKILATVKSAISTTKELPKKRTVKPKLKIVDNNDIFRDIIGESESMLKVKDLILKAAQSDSRVLILGENGTGKELVAKCVHNSSNRCGEALIEVNCAAIPSELIESEMFGHERGSFTGAVRQKKGKFELADKGTLFLDEIGDMSLSAQAKVLRALQENKITPVGGDKDISVDVRIVAATNKNLKEEVKNGNFREDLYHRLSVICINVPPLRERKGDVRLLTDFFINTYLNSHQGVEAEIAEEAIELLDKRNWHGNIRELANVVERLIVMKTQRVIDTDLVREHVDLND
ncbi:MAG: sigma-54 dependent transcriptional regulator [Rikenellaceae bacterium]